MRQQRKAWLGGLPLTGRDEAGTVWRVLSLDQWDNQAPSTGTVTQNAFGDGGWIDPAYRGSLPLRCILRLDAATPEAAEDAMALLKRSVPHNVPAPLVVEKLGIQRHRLVRVDDVPEFKIMRDLFVHADIQLIAPDSRKFGGDGSTPYQHQQTVYLPSTTGGLQIPVSAPFSIDASVVNGSVVIDTLGDAPPPVLVRINGPAVQPIIRDQDGGAMPLDITLGAGQWLDVNLDARTIKINGAVSRRNLLRGPWITPRSGTVLALDAAVYDPLTSMTVFWTDASY